MPDQQASSKWDAHVKASAVLAVLWFSLPLLISVSVFVGHSQVNEFLRGQGDAGYFIAAGIFAVAAGLGLLPTYAQSLVVGWAFPFWPALAVAVFGYVGGAILGFGVSRLAAGESVQALVDRKPQWAVVRKALVAASFWRTVGLVALVRFPPNSPFAFTNLVLAASGVRWGPMLLGSLIGMLPRTALAVWIAGQGAASGSESFGDLLNPTGGVKFVTAIVGIALFIVAMVVMQQIGVRALRAAGMSQNKPRDPAQVG